MEDKINPFVVVQTTTTALNSIIPSIEEAERFTQFLNNKLNLGLSQNLLITIEQKSPKLKGYFMPIQAQSYKNETEALNTITLNSLYLKETPYETIAHEIAHFINTLKKIDDCSSNQYHNKHFKIQAEKLHLKVERTKKGYSNTTETPEFIALLEEFKPNKEAFKIYQTIKVKPKKPSRNLLFMCPCQVKIRTAKNENKPFMAKCLYCEGEFILQTKEVEDDE